MKTVGDFQAVYSSEPGYDAYFKRAYPFARHILERKSYIDRISSYGFKCIGAVANGHLWFQIKGYGFKAYFAMKKPPCFERAN